MFVNLFFLMKVRVFSETDVRILLFVCLLVQPLQVVHRASFRETTIIGLNSTMVRARVHLETIGTPRREFPGVMRAVHGTHSQDPCRAACVE